MIEDGKIAEISKKPSISQADQNIDLKGALLLPGVIDAHVHFRDPGLTHKEDFSTGSMAAAGGGVTTICDMPNTLPLTDSMEAFNEKVRIGERKSHVDFALHAALPQEIDEGVKLAKAGAASFKLYPELREDFSISDFQEVSPTISIHPEDPRILEEFENTQDFAESRPIRAEISEISRVLDLAPNTHLHFCHTTALESIKLITKARKSRKITCEATPHHLLLNTSHLQELGPIAKTNPPLRSEENRLALLSTLREGSIDMIATDHAPHTREEKERGMEESPPGIAGVETSLPLLFTLVRRGKLSLSRMVESMCIKPARVFGLKNERGILKNALIPEADADFVAIDQHVKWKIKGEKLHGKTKSTPFEGWKVVGKPFLTIVRGETVFKEGEVIGKEGYGRFIPRKT